MSEQIKIGDIIVGVMGGSYSGQFATVLEVLPNNYFKIISNGHTVVVFAHNWSLHKAKKELNWHTEETQDVLMNVESLYLTVCEYVQFCKMRNTKRYNKGYKLITPTYHEFIKRYNLETDKLPYTNFSFSNKNITRSAMNEFFRDLGNELRTTDLVKILK